VKYPQRLATRLSVSFVLLFLVAFVVVAALTLYYARRTFQTSIDDNLQGVGETVEQRLTQEDAPTPQKVVEDLSSAAQFVEYLDPNGQVVARSSNLAQLSLPMARRNLNATHTRFRTAKFQNTQVRIIAYPVNMDGQLSGYVVAASPIETVDDSVSSLTVVVAIAGVFGLMIAGTGTVWLSRREARPLQELTEVVHETAASGFQKDVPRSGEGSTEARELREAFSNLVARQRDVIDRERAFFADSSHVLRTPLAVIQGDIELLEQGVYGKERLEVVAQARTALSTMSRAVNGLLLLAREQEAPGTDWEVVALGELLGRLVAEARVASVELTVEAAIGEGLDVAGDRHQLQDLFASIIENACIYTPPGGAVRVTASATDGNAVIEVHDTGIGLSPSEVQQAMDRFFRGAQARRMFPAGSGLGLAIAARIVRIHGGELSLRSNDDGPGATARVVLPLLG
jgi:signal transduction histidine kinase